MLRRPFLLTGSAISAGLALGGLSGTATAAPWQPEITEADRVLGDPEAPVAVIEFASFTCPHCATFHNDVMPEVKKNLIDPGQVKLIFREFPLDGVALRAGMIARCLPRETYFPFIDILFAQQPQWTRAGDPVAALRQFGRLSGLTEEQMDACLADEALANQIIQMRTDAEATYKVGATPSFVIDDTLREGGLSYDALARFVEDAANA